MASVDPVYGVNVFEETKVLSESETLIDNILMILLNRPGFYPSIPWLGMDVSQYLYSFEDSIDPLQIKVKLASQCRELLPDIREGALDVQSIPYNGRPLLLFVLPVLVDNVRTFISLGITVNDRGEMIYNFVENNRIQEL